MFLPDRFKAIITDEYHLEMLNAIKPSIRYTGQDPSKDNTYLLTFDRLPGLGGKSKSKSKPQLPSYEPNHVPDPPNGIDEVDFNGNRGVTELTLLQMGIDLSKPVIEDTQTFGY